MREIIVGIDGSENAAAALRWAVAEAALHGAGVTAVFAWGFVPPGHAGNGHTFDTGYGSGTAEAALRDAVEAAIGADAAARLTYRVVCDQAPKALLAAAGEADLLVVGARGVGGFRGMLLGSVSLQLLHHARGPLAVVHGPPPEVGPSGAGRIVVGVDGSESARRALHWARHEARLRGAGLEVVHAWHPSYVMASPVVGRPVPTSALEEEAQAVLDRAVDTELAGAGATAVTRLLVRDSAPRAVLDTAQGADLVVLGSRGRGGFTGLVLGSVTHHVALHAACPVVVVP
ncbi:MAG TPA: universal stress protein [Acidimicrobiales bacterium]|nr:universal stress protein [Acidimicrobiales bacterium]